MAAGLDPEPSVRAATTAALATNTYSAGVLTASANGALAAQDGVTLLLGERLLVKNEASALKSGIYTVTQVGDATLAYILTRATDMDAWTEVPSANCWIEEGSTLAGTAWTASGDKSGTLGTTAINWTQFGGTGAFQAHSANLTPGRV